jgi:hypothetical protein
VLVGKDRGIEFRSEKIVGVGETLDIIDGMPMRRAERG